jgi:nucleoside-diphosphate-sugar epimerase
MITGGTGFLGSHLARYLVVEQRREDVVLFDRFPVDERIADIRDRVTVVSGDVLAPAELLAAMTLHDIDRVAHLAFPPGTADPEKIVPYVDLTCLGTANVFDAARLHGITRVVNASSMAVFGPPTGRELTEDDHPRPAMLYASCKLWTEHLADVFNQQHGMEILSLRVPATMGVGRLARASLATGVMGPEVRHFMANPELAALGQSVTMPPDDQESEFIYAPDIGQAWWRALSAERPEHAVFNLSAGRFRVGELTALLRELLPDAQIAVSDVPLQPGPLMNTKRLVGELGFVPGYSLAAGTKAYVDAVRVREAPRRSRA